MINILFVCMGNICRSPSAEGFFARVLEQSAYKDLVSCDSAGTHSYHVGHAPDSRAVDTATNFGVDIADLRARKVSISDFHNYDLIVAMDRSNFADLQAIQPADSNASLKMMMKYHPEGRPEEVPDPYYGGIDGFTYMCELLESATAGLLKDVEERLGK
jgi:protein-tyrosine phosphatase